MSNDSTVTPTASVQTLPSKTAPAGGSLLVSRTALIAGVALLVDCAVETWWSGSPSRLWAVGAAVLYAAAGALTWRKPLSATARLIIAGLTLLAVAAVTSWLPDGFTHGLRVAGQPTAIVMSVATAAGLVVALIALLGATRMPMVARLVLALLAIYGIAAFALAAWQRTAYPLLFTGASLWQTAPRWVQGAIVGGLGALPLALIVTLAGGLRRERTAWRPQRIVAIGLALVLVGAGFGTAPIRPGVTTSSLRPAAAASSEHSVQGTAGSPAPPSPAAVQEPTDYKQAMEQLKSAIDYSRLDVKALQAKLGTDPHAIANFVQNEIRYEPYAGALRGARGTLLARAGNSLDRALLLADLLRLGGHTVRLGEGILSEDQADHIIRSRFTQNRVYASANTKAKEITDRAREHFIYLANALDDSGFTPPQGDAGAWDNAIRVARQHFWVQVQTNGGWTDIDPSAGVVYGQTLVPTTTQEDNPNTALFPTIEIHIDVESVEGGTRHVRSVLQYSSRTSDLAGVPVGLYHDRKRDTCTPVLVVGGAEIKGQSFATPLVIGVGTVRTPFLNPFETGGDRVTAEWLNFRVTGPTGEHTASYTILDTDGPAGRQAGAAAKELGADTVTTITDSTDAYIGIGIAMGDLPDDLLGSIMVDASDLASDNDTTRLLSMFALTHYFIRAQLPGSLLQTMPLWYLNSPNVVIARLQASSMPGATGSGTVSLDLLMKEYALLRAPDDPLRMRGSFYDRLAAGVLDHTLERWLLGAEGAHGSVGALFEAAVQQRVPPRVLASPSARTDLSLTADGRYRVANTLASGRIVVVPAGIPSGWRSGAGWWSIDPTTGATEDTTEAGGHNQFGERSLLQRVVASRSFKAFCAVGSAVALASDFAHDLFSLYLKIGGHGIALLCAAVGVAVPPGGPPSPGPPAGPPGGLPPDTFPPQWPHPGIPYNGPALPTGG